MMQFNLAQCAHILGRVFHWVCRYEAWDEGSIMSQGALALHIVPEHPAKYPAQNACALCKDEQLIDWPIKNGCALQPGVWTS